MWREQKDEDLSPMMNVCAGKQLWPNMNIENSTDKMPGEVRVKSLGTKGISEE